MRRIAVLLSSCLSLCLHASPEPADVQFRPLVANFLNSWNQHDANAFANIFAVDALITTVGGRRVQGREAIEEYLQPSFIGPVFKDSTYSATIRQARLIGAGIAVLDLDWEMTGARTRDGAPRGLRKGTLNWVLMNKDGRWEITSYHNSEFQQPTASRPQ